jgi:hypothetical protein
VSTRSSKRVRCGLFQRANDGGPFCQILRWERSLPWRFIWFNESLLWPLQALAKLGNVPQRDAVAWCSLAVLAQSTPSPANARNSPRIGGAAADHFETDMACSLEIIGATVAVRCRSGVDISGALSRPLIAGKCALDLAGSQENGSSIYGNWRPKWKTARLRTGRGWMFVVYCRRLGCGLAPSPPAEKTVACQ